MQTCAALVKQKKILCGITLLLFVISNIVLAQTNYHFTSYTQEHGIASSTITGITKDSTGFLWLMSENGLTRFDGYDFKVYRNNATDSNSISSPYVLGMFVDSSKNVFIRTANSINKYDEVNSSFKKIISYTDQSYFLNLIPGTSNSWVSLKGSIAKINGTKNSYQIFPVPGEFASTNFGQGIEHNGLLFISNWKVILKFDQATNLFTTVPITVGNITSLNLTAPALTFFINKNNAVCFYSREGLFTYNAAKGTFMQVCKSNFDSHTDFDFSGKFISSTGLLCMTNRGGDLHLINTETGYDTVINLKKYCAEHVKNDFGVMGLFNSPNNCVWANTLSSGIFKINLNTFSVQQFQHENGNEYSLTSNGSNYIFDDNNGVLWVSLPGIGLAKGEQIKPVFKSFAPLTGSDVPVASLKKNIRGVLEYDANNLLLLTLDGAFVFNKHTQQYSFINHPVTSQPMFTKIAWGDAVYDNDSTLWVGSWRGNSLFSINKKQKNKNASFPFILNGIKQTTSVRCLHIDTHNNLWIGTADKIIYRLNLNSVNFAAPDNTHFEVFSSGLSKNDSLTFNINFNITENKNGDVFFGTQNGLFCYNYSSNSFTRYVNIPGNRNSLSNDDVRAVYADKQNNLWIGTNGGGLNCFNQSTKTFTCFKTENGLPDNIIYTILEDEKGFLWLGTNKGLCRFDKEKIISRNYSIKDGIQNYEFNTNAACKTINGELIFGGVNGFNIFNPDSIEITSTPTKIIITEFKVGDKDRSISNKNIHLKHSENYLTFQFASLNYFRNSENQYAYKLDGLDNDWIYCGTRRFTNYANLSPGTYTFRVKAANCYGEWSEASVALTITIATAWYNTVWFRIMLVLLVTTIVYAIFRIRLSQKLSLMEVRNKIARDLHDEIGSNLSSISLFSAVANETASDEKNPVVPLLKKISEYTQSSQDAMNDIVWMINARNDSFENIIVRMRALAAELFEAKNVNLHLNFSEKLNNLKIGMDERKNFYLIYKEAINNIVKYAECQNVWIDLSMQQATIILNIKDDGKGFDTQKKYTGNGLLNMHNRTQALHGKLSINSQSEKGTTIELRFEI